MTGAPESNPPGSGQDRPPRAAERLRIRVHVSLQVVISEGVLRRQNLEGDCVDISSLGMQIKIRSLPSELYSKIHEHPRLVRVKFASPLDGKDIVISGRNAWIDFFTPSGAEDGECRIGIKFDDLFGPDMERLHAFLSTLHSQ